MNRSQPSSSLTATACFPLYLIAGVVIVLTGSIALVSSVVDTKPAARASAPVAKTTFVNRANIGS